jgi:hypothetical protein
MGVLSTCDGVLSVFKVHITEFHGCFDYMSRGFFNILSTCHRVLWMF